MKQLLFSKGKPKVIDMPTPQLRDGMVLVKNHYSFISSGTERAMLSQSGRSVISRLSGDFKQTFKKLTQAYQDHGLKGGFRLAQGAMARELEVGYSCAGQVVDAAPDTGFKAGDLVASAGAGFAVHAQMCAVPKNLVVPVANEHDLKASSVVAVGAIALQGFRRSQLVIGETVCVVGLGLVGLLTVQIARNAGCKVVGIDPNPERRKQALASGAQKVLDPMTDAVAREIMYGISPHGVDATIIAAPCRSGKLINQAIEITKKRGRIVAVGDVAFNFERELFYRKEQDLVVSCSYGPGRYDNAYEKHGVDYPYEFVRWTENRNMQCIVDMIASKQLDVLSLVEKDYDILQADQAYEDLNQNKGVGLIFSYNHAVELEKNSVELFAKKAMSDDVKLAMVGAGGFAKTKLLPLLSEMKGVYLKALVSQNAAKSRGVAKQFGIQTVSSDFQSVLPDVDTVVIATPHKFHAAQTLQALTAGKSVFVEKPAVVNFDELSELKSSLSKHKDAVWFVDFNRSYAPLIAKAKQVLDERSSSILINYRMNAGMIPADHWVNNDGNGGRIIGECCHIFELFLTMVGVKVRSICVAVSQSKVSPNNPENITASLMFVDGSSATLTYAATGNKAMSKERMELFWEGKSIVMDDFKALTGFGLNPKIDVSLSSQDKGHEQILTQFVAVARGNQPVDQKQTRRWLTAMDVALHADRLARVGGGFHIFE